MPMRSGGRLRQGLGHLALVDAGDRGDGRMGLLRVADLELDQQAAQLTLVARQRAVQQHRAFGGFSCKTGERVDVLLDAAWTASSSLRSQPNTPGLNPSQVFGGVFDVFVDVEEGVAFFGRGRATVP